MTDLNLSATELYRAGSAEKVETDALYHITGDTNFYAIANITEITTQAGLADINATAAALDGNYTLLKDIALDETGAGFEDTYGWKPIGDSSDPFTGIFNGNGHKITGLWIYRPSEDFVGLFGRASSAVFKNIGVEIANGKEVKGNDYVGGIVGGAMYSTITNSYTTGDVNGTRYVGGIAGYTNYGTITNSSATGNISGGDYYIGGIVGYVANGSITNSYATGNISGGDGGIAGMVYYGTVTNNAAINQQVSASSDFVNRIVSYINSSTVSNNFALDTMTVNSAIYNGATNERNGTSKTMPELKTQSTYSSQVDGGGLGWKFGNDVLNPWKIDANKNNGYPYLYYQDR
ncbi:MAG: hypothetical protein LBE89_04040 [Helicobacteraceae bacterium]|jgi:hypothetical protein|nr:hypothetical protein [Helicobacteraceae bacterium]